MMARSLGLFGLALGAGFATAGPAAALEEIKAGVLGHNICISACSNANKEDGPVIDVQLNFRSPGVLRAVGSPRPYVSASPNVSGDPSFVAAGLEWRWEFAEGWAFTPGLGYALHNGETQNPFPNGTPQSTAFNNDNVLYGSEDLFRTSLGLTRDLGETWRVEGFVVHYSHGQILGNGRNQGVDQAGVRLGYRFGA
ncbi:MAG: acyloxyacyl hydrolase [Hyphomonadaceae bacterium]|nr:acyloxyacyl hydrolase [Hyphomonadaceae bacterium]